MMGKDQFPIPPAELRQSCVPRELRSYPSLVPTLLDPSSDISFVTFALLGYIQHAVALEVVKTIGEEFARLGIHAPHGSRLIFSRGPVPVLIHQPAAVQGQRESEVRGDLAAACKSAFPTPFPYKKV